jgi:hypothetical protein
MTIQSSRSERPHRDSACWVQTRAVSHRAPAPGLRPIQNGKPRHCTTTHRRHRRSVPRVASLLHDARPVLVDLTGGHAAATARGWEDRFDVVVTILGTTLSALLVRPDGCVAWACHAYVTEGRTNPGRVAL